MSQRSSRAGSMSRPLVDRVQVGALYTEGQDLWEVVEVHALGTVTLINDDMRERTIGIDAFRARFWLVRVPDTARFDAPGCQMCGAPEGDPCECHDPQGPEFGEEMQPRACEQCGEIDCMEDTHDG